MSQNPSQTGPSPFITLRYYQKEDNSYLVWQSRHHRKRLHGIESEQLLNFFAIFRKSLWMPWQFNWWIGLIFALGSLLFMVGSLLSLSEVLAKIFSLSVTDINQIFFAGSIPFTIAAYLQLFQSANAGEFSVTGRRKPSRTIWFGWRPQNIGWLSCSLQFVGTIFFNFNTFNAMYPDLNWFEQDLVIWIPNFLGSILFLISGYLAFIETCHAYWAWKVTSISWWVTFINFLGCVAFMISALFAFVTPQLPSAYAINMSLIFTLIGAVGFLISSLLMLPETAMS